MRKVTRLTCEAFERGEVKSIGNTRTDGHGLYLHGNKIAEWREGEVYVSLAGWDTVTTRERLNGIDGCNVYRRKGVTYINGIEFTEFWQRVV